MDDRPDLSPQRIQKELRCDRFYLRIFRCTFFWQIEAAASAPTCRQLSFRFGSSAVFRSHWARGSDSRQSLVDAERAKDRIISMTHSVSPSDRSCSKHARRLPRSAKLQFGWFVHLCTSRTEYSRLSKRFSLTMKIPCIPSSSFAIYTANCGFYRPGVHHSGSWCVRHNRLPPRSCSARHCRRRTIRR
jgi:hypothetical protein